MLGHQSRKPATGRTGARAIARASWVVVLALAAFMLVPASTTFAASTCTPEQGQAFIDEGRLDRAVHEFSCVIDAEPTQLDGYRGRAEALLLLGRFSDAYHDYNAGITALVVPVHPDAFATIHAEYSARLSSAPDSVPALTGASFARWVDFDYAQAIQVLNHLLEVEPDDVYANLFRGSSRLLNGATKAKGAADLDRAIQLAPASPDVRYVVADAYTYGLVDPERAASEATLALEWGLDTARVHAILASSYNAFGDLPAAAEHIERHIELVTTELVATPSLGADDTVSVDLVPGRTYAIPIPATAGETISISTTSKDFWDSIGLLLTPDGSPVVGSDDDNAYFAAFDWVALQTGTYVFEVTSFESVSTGELAVKRS